MENNMDENLRQFRETKSEEGRGEYDIEQDEDKNKIIIRGIVESGENDRIILQHKLVDLGVCDKLLKWRDMRRLGMMRSDGEPRPILIECNDIDKANEIYLKYPGINEGKTHIKRYKSRKNIRKRKIRWNKKKKKQIYKTHYNQQNYQQWKPAQFVNTWEKKHTPTILNKNNQWHTNAQHATSSQIHPSMI